ncbi:MAG: head GIN domain-containing protein [Bacteroidia bacterium]
MRTYNYKNLLFLILNFICGSTLFGQITKPLPEFNKIEAGEAFKILLIPSDSNSIVIGTKNEADVLTEVKNGTLHLKSNFKSAVNWNVKIFFKGLNELTLEGTAQAICRDTIHTQSFYLKSSGTSLSDLIINCDTLKINAEGVSQTLISGSAITANYIVEGASKLNAQNVTAQKIDVRTEGTSNAKIRVNESLSAHAEGISRIIYGGNPINKSIAIDGLATVKSASGSEEFNNEKALINKNDGDTTRLKIGRKKLLIINEDNSADFEKTFDEKPKNSKRKMKSVWGGFALGVTGMTTKDMNFNFSTNYKFLNTKLGESWFFDLNLPEYDAQIIRNKLAVTMGLGMQWNNIHFAGNNYLTPKSDTLSSTNAGVNLNLNKLFTFDITAPLLIKFAPGSRKRAKGGFHLAAGVIGHYITTSSVITETLANGYMQRVVFNDNFNINPFRLDATVRVGYSRVKLFANYSLTPYFNTGAGPDVRLFAAGLTLVGF